MELIVDINKRLLDLYGTSYGDLPKYRVVWGGSQRETRTGLFTKHTEAGIYLGEAVRTEEVKKYPMWEHHWILEIPLPNLANPELKTGVSYEPLFIFKDENDFPLPYDWEVIQKIIYHHMNPRPQLSQSAMDHDFEEAKQIEAARILDELQHDKVMPNRMYDTPLITVPPNYSKH